MEKRPRSWLVLLLALMLSAPAVSVVLAAMPQTDEQEGPSPDSPPDKVSRGRAAGGQPERPDIVLSELNWSLAGAYDGASGTLYATVFDDGAQVNAPFSVDLYVDGDAAGGAVVNGLTGGSATTVKVPWTASSGDHELRAVADAAGIIEESNETNNFKIAYVDVPYPDLAIQNVSWYPESYREGDKVTVAATVANLGNGSTLRSFVLEAFIDHERLTNRIFGGLGAESTSLTTFQWTAEAGDHTMFLAVDPADAVKESNEQNNRMDAKLGEEFPDLTLAGLSVSPGNLTDGGPALLTATVQNRGTGATTQRFTVAFIADGETVGATGVFGLDANSSTSVTLGWTAAAGHHDIRATCDAESVVAEAVESNNHQVISFDVPYPDLAISELRCEPTVPTDGRQARVNITVQNRGAGPTSRDFSVLIMADGVQIGSPGVAGLLAGEEATLAAFWTPSAGDHELRALADPTRTVPELNETDNAAVRPVNVPYPDIALGNFNVTPERPQPGDLVTLRASVRNAGSGNTSRYFDVMFYAGGEEAGRVPFDGLSAGASRNVSVTWTAVPGILDIAAVADPRNEIRESGELNNTVVMRLSVPYPDLAVMGMVCLPPDATAGQPLNVSVMLRNNGTGNVTGEFLIALYANGTLAAAARPAGLPAGQNLTVNLTILLPASLVLLRAELDAQDTVSELSETNNNITLLYPGPTAVPAPTPPDIGLKELRMFPAAPVDGDAVSLVATVEAANMSSGGPIWLNLLLLVDGQKSASRKAEVLAGQGIVTFDWKATSGNHSIMVMAEQGQLIDEAREDNNWLSLQLVVLPPDLLLADLLPAQPFGVDGVAAAVFCNLSNSGPGDTRNEVTVSFFVDGELMGTARQKGLPSKRSSSLVFSFTAFPGTHRLRAVVDQSGGQLQTSYTNDQALSQLQVGLPELLISNLTLPAQAGEGDKVSFSALVSNLGAGTARDLQATLFVDAVQVARRTVAGVTAGGTALVTGEWTAQPGQHLLTAKVDTAAVVGEPNEGDNWLSASGMAVQLAELQMRNLTAQGPPVQGTDWLVYAEISNNGSATMRPFTTGFYLDEKLVKTIRLDGFPENSTYTVAQTFPLGPGAHTLVVSADVLGAVAELDETNNNALLELALPESPEPSLVGLKVPLDAADGQLVYVFAELENAGGANFTDRFTVSFFVDGMRLADLPVEGLPANGSTVVSARWTATPGNHYFKAVADSTGLLQEADETDNELHRQGASVEQPDLTVSEVSAVKGPGQSGTDAFTVFATVENIGGTTLRHVHLSAMADSVPLGNIVLNGLPGRNATQVSFPAHYLNPQRLTVIADPDGSIWEHNEFDNEAGAGYDPFNEDPSLRPDLTVTDIIVSPAEPADGQPCVVFVTVSNIGSASMTSGADLQLTPGGSNASHLKLHGLLPGGKAVVGFPYMAEGGSTEFNATIDPQRTVPEPNEGNNELFRTLDVLHPDYAVTRLVRWNSTEGLGDPLFAIVENLGIGDTLRSSTLDFHVEGVRYYQQGFNGLLAGERLTLTIPRVADPGDSEISVIVDPQGLTPETSYANNKLNETFYASFPELSVGKINWTSQFDNGSTTTLFAEVQNTGTGAAGRTFHVSFSIDSRKIDDLPIAGLPANSTTILTWKWAAGPGAHTFSAMADSTDAVWEPSENNNRLTVDYPSGQVGLDPAFLNLRLSNLTFASSRNETAGNDTITVITLFIQSENDGQQNLTASSAYVLVDSLLLTVLTIPPVPFLGNVTVAYPWNATIANHTVKVVLDSGRLLPEDIETDNDITLFIEGNDPPYADAGMTYKVLAGDPLTFRGSGNDLDGYVALYEWDLDGDGRYEYSSNVSATVEHVYHTNGTYVVRLRVTDDQGATAVSTAVVKVTLKKESPLIRADAVTFVAVVLSSAMLASAAVMLYKKKGEEPQEK